jgi:hypothetical protein
MSMCRIARRVALTKQVNNRCSQAVNVQTLATKVLHLSLQPFWSSGWAARRRLAAHTQYPKAVGEHVRDLSCRAGVWLRMGGAASRRFASPAASRTTPFNTSSLVTNDGVSEAVR